MGGLISGALSSLTKQLQEAAKEQQGVYEEAAERIRVRGCGTGTGTGREGMRVPRKETVGAGKEEWKAKHDSTSVWDKGRKVGGRKGGARRGLDRPVLGKVAG